MTLNKNIRLYEAVTYQGGVSVRFGLFYDEEIAKIRLQNYCDKHQFNGDVNVYAPAAEGSWVFTTSIPVRC